MKYNRIMRNWMIAISGIFLAITIAFSFLQVKYENEIVFAIANNISICILTGCLIALLQFIVGYHNSKHSCLLVYYRDLVMIEKKIIHYPFMHLGFVNAQTGLKDVKEILDFYSYNVRLSYLQIDFDGYCDKTLSAAKELFTLYEKQIAVFKRFEDALCEGIRFMGKSDEDLINDGVTDIKKATQEMNAFLQSKEKDVENAYNDVIERGKRNSAYQELEKFLFNKKKQRSLITDI